MNKKSIDILKRKEEVKEYFESDSLYNIMKTTLSYMLDNREIEFKLNPGGGSYTDGDTLVVGLIEDFLFESYKTIYLVLIALLGHESQHVLSSSFIEFGEYNNRVSLNVRKETNISMSLSRRITHFIGNALEDGRIERILANKLPGIIPKLKFLNMHIWKVNEITRETEAIPALFSAILTTSKLGILPKGFDKYYGNTQLDDVMVIIKPLITKATKSTTCKGCLDISEEILIILYPFLKQNLNQEEEQETFDNEMKDLMDELMPEEDYEGAQETELNNNQQQTVRLDENHESQDNTGASSENESKEGESESSDDDSNYGGSKDVDDTKTSSSKELENQIEKELSELGDSLEKEAEKAFDKSKKEETKRNKENAYSEPVSEEDIVEIRKNIGISNNFCEHDINFKLTLPIFPEVKLQANKFRKEIAGIFNNKQGLNLNGQTQGVINSGDLYRIGMHDYNVFTIEGHKSSSDYVAYVLRDGSGSMSGEKDYESMKALAIIEEGLRDSIPFKLVSFSASRYSVNHNVIRNFNHTNNKSYSTNYYQNNRADSYNDDGYSISIATKELMNRPESDKVLIILSDGMPDSIQTTKASIKEARRLGINVIGIAFGDEYFRKNNINSYKYMYEINFISTEPKGIPRALTSLLRKTLIR